MELYEVINWKDQPENQWKLADESWECNANRIVFYALDDAPQQLLQQLMIRERDTNNGGHGCFEYSIFCRSEINRHTGADIADQSERDDLFTHWREKYKPKAQAIVAKEYDREAIKHDKILLGFYNECVELEIRKALVYTIDDFDPDVGKQARKAVDDFTTKLGMAYSQLGYLAHHPKERPKGGGKKPMKAPKSKTAKVNVPARLLRGLEALKSKEKSFLEEFIDQEGSFKAAIEVLKNKDQVVEDPRSAQKILQLQGELDKSLQVSNAKNVRIQ